MSEGNNEIAFGSVVPLPFKIILFVHLGCVLWYSIVKISHKYYNINVISLLNLSYASHNYTELDSQMPSNGEYSTTIPAEIQENVILSRGIKNNLKKVFINTVICWFIYILIGGQVNKFGLIGRILKLIYFVIPFYALGYTGYVVFYKNNSKGQYRAYTTLKRVIRGNINSASMRTNDILLSDSLVSFSKVLNDFGLFLWINYCGDKPYSIILEFFILCIPIFIRVKQCWSEYSSTKNILHLFNLIKYLSSLGPLILNVCIKKTLYRVTGKSDDDQEQIDVIMRLNNLNNLWYFASTINSGYSFIWDIKMDWSLQMFDKFFDNKRHPLLRPSGLLVFSNATYYACIFIDFCLRFIWVLKFFIIEEARLDNAPYLHQLSTFLFGYDIHSLGYTLIELFEILRRWMWCFLKLESDWIKMHGYYNANTIELNSLQNKQ